MHDILNVIFPDAILSVCEVISIIVIVVINS